MKAFWQVATREFAARRMVLWTGAAIAVLALAAPFFPGNRTYDPADVRAFVTVFLGVALAAASALLVGASVLGTDLSERRIAFFFSRPISASALWWGKVVGGFAVVLLGASVSMLPNLLPGRSSLLSRWGIEFAADAAKICLFLVFLFVLAAALSVALRSHSPWLLADAVCLAASGAFAWISARVLLRAQAGGVILPAGIAFGVVVLAALVLAGWRQVADGRVDLKRAHRAMSTTLWSIVLPASLLMVGYGTWATAYRPSDLKVELVRMSHDGRWLLAAGEVTGRGARFWGWVFVEPSTSRFVRPGSAGWNLVVSRDGRRAAWVEWDGTSPRDSGTVVTLDLSARDSRPVASKIVVNRLTDLESMDLSPDGKRLALLMESILTVYDPSTGALLASVRLDGRKWSRHVVFESGTSLRLFPRFVRRSEALPIERLDIAAKRLETTGRIEIATAKQGVIRVSPAGDRLLSSGAGSALVLLDGTTGHPLATLAPPSPADGHRSAGFLSDGRIAVAASSRGTGTLALFSRDGVPEKTIPLGNTNRMQLGGEPAVGKLALTVSPGASPEGGRLLIVDLVGGTATTIGQPFRPALLNGWNVLSDDGYGAPGSLGTLLFIDNAKGYFLFDPATNRLTPFSLR